jgi:cellulose synthase/poly-beta-1,6-N-acetylglucosamine synthase-like glycosyltransferase
MTKAAGSPGSKQLAVLVPVLARPGNVKPLLHAFKRTTPTAVVYFIADPDDRAEHDAVRAAGGRLLIHAGGFAAKINHAVQVTNEPLIAICGDDVDPQPGWLEHATARLTDTVQVVGVNDDIQRPTRPEHATHFLLTRQYAHQPCFDGTPGPCSQAYTHFRVDDELIATAARRGAYAHAPDSHIRHLHPMNGAADDDDTYRKGRKHANADSRLFHQRMRQLRRTPKTAGFGLTVICGTYGTPDWPALAHRRAIPSARKLGVPVIHRHDRTLARARNAALADVRTDHVVCLDADDELHPGFLQAIARADADLRAPSVQSVRDGKPVRGGLFMPRVAGHRHECTGDCLPYGSWLVIGTCARAELLRHVGGWQEEEIYEDWACWLRCWQAGASIQAVPDAVYIQHLSPTSRNHAGSAFEQREQWHQRIVTSVLGAPPPYPPPFAVR